MFELNSILLIIDIKYLQLSVIKFELQLRNKFFFVFYESYVLFFINSNLRNELNIYLHTFVANFHKHVNLSLFTNKLY